MPDLPCSCRASESVRRIISSSCGPAHTGPSGRASSAGEEPLDLLGDRRRGREPGRVDAHERDEAGQRASALLGDHEVAEALAGALQLGPDPRDVGREVLLARSRARAGARRRRRPRASTRRPRRPCAGRAGSSASGPKRSRPSRPSDGVDAEAHVRRDGVDEARDEPGLGARRPRSSCPSTSGGGSRRRPRRCRRGAATVSDSSPAALTTRSLVSSSTPSGVRTTSR